MANPEENNSDDDDLPEIRLTPLRNKNSSTSFQVDTIVWAWWKDDYWPALVRTVNKPKKKATVIFIDQPTNHLGKEIRLTMMFKKLIKFDSSEKSTELKKSADENKQAKIDLAIEYELKRITGKLSVTPIEFFKDPICDSLTKQRAAKKGQKKSENPTTQSPIETSPTAKGRTTKVPPTKSPTVKSPPAGKPSVKRKLVEDPVLPLLEPLVGMDDDPEDNLSHLTIVPVSHTDIELYEKLVNVIKSEECQKHLTRIRQGEVESVRHQLHSCPTPSKRLKLKFISFNRIMDDKQMNALVMHFREVLTKQLAHKSKRLSDTVNVINYVMDVWVPEALSYGLQSVFKISSEAANEMIEGKNDELPAQV